MSIDTDVTTDETTDDTSDRPALGTIGEPARHPTTVEVRRRPGIAAALGSGASLVAVAYLARAAGGGGVLDWVVALVLGLVGIANLAALLDARTPLVVADDLGVRLRLGRTWVGLPWGGLHEVEHEARRGWWHDGLIIVRTHYVQRVLEDLDSSARRVARVNARLHHAPLAVPLGLATKVVGAPDGLTAALRALADGRTPIVEREREQVPNLVPEAEPEAEWTELDEVEEREPLWRRLPDPRPTIAHLIGVVAARVERPGRDEADEARRGRWRDRGRVDRRRGRARRRGERDTRPGPRDRDRGPRRGPTRGPSRTGGGDAGLGRAARRRRGPGRPAHRRLRRTIRRPSR